MNEKSGLLTAGILDLLSDGWCGKISMKAESFPEPHCCQLQLPSALAMWILGLPASSPGAHTLFVFKLLHSLQASTDLLVFLHARMTRQMSHCQISSIAASFCSDTASLLKELWYVQGCEAQQLPVLL